ncbi:uncharacterized protein LOC136081182 [Hydra vulgaris]|uniref:Uncharacterized protein LOC136081182 n=1 Tax=Hydra vulgaris TaxID=6087 RepID=A0ABM4BZ68_HYDVU
MIFYDLKVKHVDSKVKHVESHVDSGQRDINSRLLTTTRILLVVYVVVSKELERGFQSGGLIDDQLQIQVARAAQKRKQVLERVTAAIQMLTQQNLALRVHNEFLQSDEKSGNFLALMKFLAKFDPFMKEHLESVSSKSGSLSYISHGIQNKLINLLGSKVRKSIILNVKNTKYYSIILNTNPGSSQVEQMSQIIRYVDIERGKVTVKEAFLDFIQVHGKSAEAITREITKSLI